MLSVLWRQIGDKFSGFYIMTALVIEWLNRWKALFVDLG